MELPFGDKDLEDPVVVARRRAANFGDKNLVDPVLAARRRVDYRRHLRLLWKAQQRLALAYAIFPQEHSAGGLSFLSRDLVEQIRAVLPDIRRMQIFVRDIHNKCICVHVYDSDLVEDVKVDLMDKIPIDYTYRFYSPPRGKHLTEGSTLADYGIRTEETIHMLPGLRPVDHNSYTNWGAVSEMHAYVASSWTNCTREIVIATLGSQFTLGVEGSDTVESIKIKIQDRVGIPPDRQRLCYDYNKDDEAPHSGKFIRNTEIEWLTLVDNFVSNGSVLTVIQRLAKQ